MLALSAVLLRVLLARRTPTRLDRTPTLGMCLLLSFSLADRLCGFVPISNFILSLAPDLMLLALTAVRVRILARQIPIRLNRTPAWHESELSLGQS